MLLTHTHEDHVAGVAELSALGMPVLAHPDAPGGFHGTNIAPGEAVRFGALEIDAIHLPGHDPAQLASPGRLVAAQPHSDLPAHRRRPRGAERGLVRRAHDGHSGSHPRASAETVILPGHGPATTVADELAANPFHAALQRRRCASGAARVPRRQAVQPAGRRSYLLIAPDYDGGLKALVRFPTIGRAMVPGSQLYTAEGQPWR